MNKDIIYEYRCSVCDGEFAGHGNNAEPYAKGKCCEECNNKYVLPARLRQMTLPLEGASHD